MSLIKKNFKLDGYQVFYLEKNESCNEAILFIHGNSFSSDYFMAQFSFLGLSNYRLIALDLPGHGESDPLPPSKYNLPNFASVVAEAIKALNLKKFILAGHSLGGHIVLELLGKEAPVGCEGAFIWASPPLSNPPDFASAYQDNPDIGLFFKGHLEETEIDSLLNICLEDSNTETEVYAMQIRKTDPLVREEIFLSVSRLEFLDELAVIHNLRFPIAVIYGTKDKINSTAYFRTLSPKNLWKGAPLAIEGGHNLHIENEKPFNSLLKSFADEMFGSKEAANV